MGLLSFGVWLKVDTAEDQTELEFMVLAWASYNNKAHFFPDGEQIQILPTETEQDLLDRGLLTWKLVKVGPNKNFDIFTGRVLTCTAEGKEVLQRDVLKLVLTLAGLEIHLHNPEFQKLVDQLSKEELPVLLAHPDDAVRSAALTRIRNM